MLLSLHEYMNEGIKIKKNAKNFQLLQNDKLAM